jgi:hypothetical protein
MLELIKACYEIRALRGRQALGLLLEPADQAALKILERLFGVVGPPRARLTTRVPVLFKLHAGRAADGAITDLSPDGAFVETQAILPVGAVTCLRVRDDSGGRDYHFSCQVARTTARGMGVALVGIPVECRYQRSEPPLASAA